MKNKKILKWIGATFYLLFAVVSISQGGIIFGLFFAFLAVVVSPQKEDIINKLPEKLRKKGLITLTGIVLFFVGVFTYPNDKLNNENNQIAEDSTIMETETEGEVLAKDMAEDNISAEKSNDTEGITEIDDIKEASTTENANENKTTISEKNTETVVTNNSNSITSEAVSTTQALSNNNSITQELSNNADSAVEATTQVYVTEEPQTLTTEAQQTTQTPTTEAPQTTQASSSNNDSGGENLSGYAATQPLEGRIVYITNTGQKYHESNCRTLKDSKIEISLTEAESRGYTPCGICH